MQDTSAIVNWDTIVESGNFWYETRLIIDGVGTYGEADLFAMSTTHEMFHNAPTIGSAVAGEITVKMVYPKNVTIPTMAKLLPQVRVRNSSLTSGWLSQGVYFIDTRERTLTETNEEVLELHGYDAMLKAEQMYNGRITTTSTDTDMVDEIAYQMGVDVDQRTYTLMTEAYEVPFPTGYSYREILGYIAAMYVGCFIINEIGELRLVTITELPPETNLLVWEGGDPIQFGDDCILV